MALSPDDIGSARTPILVVDALELQEHLRELLGDNESLGAAYTESYSWKKTDFGPNAGVAVAASRQILGGDVRSVGGWMVAETTGTAGAAFRLRDGNNNAGESFGRINLAANESTRDFETRKGIRCFTGRVFLEIISGSVEGVLFWR